MLFFGRFVQFFDMPKYDAINALAIYKRAGLQVCQLLYPHFCGTELNFSMPSLPNGSQKITVLTYQIHRQKTLLNSMTSANNLSLPEHFSFLLSDRLVTLSYILPSCSTAVRRLGAGGGKRLRYMN